MQQHAIPKASNPRTVRQPLIGVDQALQDRWKPSSPPFHTGRWDGNADPLPVEQAKIRRKGAGDSPNGRIVRFHLRVHELGTHASHGHPRTAVRKLPHDFPGSNAPDHAGEDPRSRVQESSQVTRDLGKIFYVIQS